MSEACSDHDHVTSLIFGHSPDTGCFLPSYQSSNIIHHLVRHPDSSYSIQRPQQHFLHYFFVRRKQKSTM